MLKKKSHVILYIAYLLVFEQQQRKIENFIMIFTMPPLPPSPYKPPMVTIWIHGTKPEELFPAPLMRLAQKITPVFDCKKGFYKSSDLTETQYPFTFTHALSETSPTQFPWEHFYIFGWSGKLTAQDRKNASHELFQFIKQTTQECIKKFNCKPEFTLISHSHGGNVILHMAEIDDPDNFTISIAKVILLACPVQKKTTLLINNPMFEKIYSLHSHNDFIQIADPQGLHVHKKVTWPLLSERHFPSHPKLAQACIRWKNGPLLHPADDNAHNGLLKTVTQTIKIMTLFKKNRGLFHIEFKLLPFIRQLPSVITQLDHQFIPDSTNHLHNDHAIVLEL